MGEASDSHTPISKEDETTSRRATNQRSEDRRSETPKQGIEWLWREQEEAAHLRHDEESEVVEVSEGGAMGRPGKSGGVVGEGGVCDGRERACSVRVNSL